MKTIEMKCPNCGAPLKQTADKEKAVCEYCGYQMLFEHEDTIEEIREKAHAKSFGYHKGKLDAQAAAMKEEKRRSVAKKLIIAGVILLVITVAALWPTYSKPEINPFDYIQVSFQGVDGKGEAVLDIITGTDDIDVHRVHYDISKGNRLTQGETVTVYAESEQYRLSEQSKTYVVEGLDEYLKDLTILPQETLDMLHDQAESCLDLNLDNAKNAGILESMKPVKLVLATDGKQKNNLYDVFEVNFATNDGDKTFYVIAHFSNVVVRNGKQVSLQMSSGTYFGGITQVQGWIHIMAYDSLEAVEATLLGGQDSYMEIKELDFTQN